MEKRRENKVYGDILSLSLNSKLFPKIGFSKPLSQAMYFIGFIVFSPYAKLNMIIKHRIN